MQRVFGLRVHTILFVALLMSSHWLPVFANDDITDVTLITDSDYMPYSYHKDGELAGITVDLIAQINTLLPDYNIKLKAMPWRKGLNTIRDGNALGIVGTYYSGTNREWIYPYSQPLLYEDVVVMCSPDVELAQPVKWPGSFAGLLVLNIAGYDGWLDFGVRNLNNTKIINFFEVPTTTIAYNMLRNDNADCALSEQRFAELTLSGDTNGDPDNKPVIVTKVSRKPIYLGYSYNAIATQKYPFALEFAKAFDFALYQLQSSGKATN